VASPREAADPGSRFSSFEIKRYTEACHGMRACKHRADFCSALRCSDGGLSPCFNRGPSQRYDAFASFGTVTSLKRATKKAQSITLCAFNEN